MKKAIVFGSTGFVGSHLLRDLLSSADYDQVTAVVRRDSNIRHPKLKMLIGDYNSLTSLKAEINADEVFIALGTTRKNSPKQAVYYQVDHDYPVLAARIAKERGARSVFLVTAVDANPHSRFFYTRTKGETERDIIALGLEHTHIFRPSMILGARRENRAWSETVLIKVWSAINPVLAWMASQYTGITGEDIAKAMIRSAVNQTEKLRIYHWKEMNDLLRRDSNSR